MNHRRALTRTKDASNMYLNKILSKCFIILRKRLKWHLGILLSLYFNQKLINVVKTIEFAESNSFCKVVFHFFLLSLYFVKSIYKEILLHCEKLLCKDCWKDKDRYFRKLSYSRKMQNAIENVHYLFDK